VTPSGLRVVLLRELGVVLGALGQDAQGQGGIQARAFEEEHRQLAEGFDVVAGGAADFLRQRNTGPQRGKQAGTGQGCA